MKTPMPLIDMNMLPRREMLKAAVAGIGLAALPGAVLAAATTSKVAMAPIVGVGYWQHPQSIDLNHADDVVVDASTVAAGEGASYTLRVLSAVSDTTLAIDAQYAGNAAHRFWQAWSEGGMLQQSHTSSIIWWAQNRRALPLTVWSGGGASLTQVPARAGTYVLAIGPNAQRLPAWSDLALRATNRRNLRTLQLISRGSNQRVAFPYLVFGVEQAAAV